MEGAAANAFSLDVGTRELTRALRIVRKVERQATRLWLKYSSEMLIVSIGRTSQLVPATGTWPQPVVVDRDWAETLVNYPMDVAIITLRIVGEKLYTRDFGVICSLETCVEEDDPLIVREEDLARASQILARYNIVVEDLRLLVMEANASTAHLWGANENALIDDIALDWKRLAVHGIDPSDIRRLTNQKSTKFWENGPHAHLNGHGAIAKYNVTDRETRELIEDGDPEKARLWGPSDHGLIDDIAQAWKHLVLYGVEPSAIRRLIDRKSR